MIEVADQHLTRGPIEALTVDVTGEEAADRTAPGLWPFDHAGVVAKLMIER